MRGLILCRIRRVLVMSVWCRLLVMNLVLFVSRVMLSRMSRLCVGSRFLLLLVLVLVIVLLVLR